MKWRRSGGRILALVRLKGVEVFLLCYLLFVAHLRNPLLVSAILFLLAGPVILSLRKLPAEVRALFEVWRSDNPEEESLFQDVLRREGIL